MIDIVLCAEQGPLERKAALLVHTIRKYGGILAEADVYAYAPRPGRTPSESFRRICDQYRVTIVAEPLNREFTDYPLANKPLACAYHAGQTAATHLLFLDSDTLVINPFTEADLPMTTAILLNPVDYDRMATDTDFRGDEGDYWRKLYELLDVKVRRTVRTTVTRRKILAYYNSGFVMADKRTGVFQAWADNFRTVWQHGLTPRRGRFFVEQSVLSATIAQLELDVTTPGRAVNFPVRNYLKKWRGFYPLSLKNKKHLHYHKLFDEAGRNVLAAKLARLPRGADLNAAVDRYLFGEL